MATKDAAIEIMKKLIQKLQGDIKTLKTRRLGQSTKKTDSSRYKKGSWRSNSYFWTHGFDSHDGEQ